MDMRTKIAFSFGLLIGNLITWGFIIPILEHRAIIFGDFARGLVTGIIAVMLWFPLMYLSDRFFGS